MKTLIRIGAVACALSIGACAKDTTGPNIDQLVPALAGDVAQVTADGVAEDVDVMRDVEAHALSDLDAELGGVLLGGQYEDDQGQPFVVISDSLRAEHYENSKGSFKFTHETWSDITRKRDEFPADLEMVGWYHTHPSMGVFLSHYDTWLHSNFFPEPWQVALVVEPVSATGGFFVRQRHGLLDPTRYFGFYELDGNYGRSMVYWTNLYQLEEEKGDASK